MNPPGDRLQDLDVPRRGGPVVSIVREAHVLGDGRDDLVDVEPLDLRVDVDIVWVKQRRVRLRVEDGHRQGGRGRERVLVRRGVASGFGWGLASDMNEKMGASEICDGTRREGEKGNDTERCEPRHASGRVGRRWAEHVLVD